METSMRIAGRYRLDELIATGGMGAVWRGHDTRLKRPVAVKLLRKSVFHDHALARERFEREAQAAAKLKGSGFAAVYDQGEDEVGPDELAYLVMEYVQGESLKQVIDDDRRPSPERVMDIIASVADTLQVVHGEGVVHRDIKPSNILVGADGTVKLVDFGIARLNDTSSLTATDTVLGTAVYASPEQLTLDEVTGSADIYSLGVVAYECLAGRPPFRATDPVTLIARHVKAPPPPLPDSVPDQIAEVVLKALEKDPEDRWGSAREFAVAAQAAAEGYRIAPAPRWSAQARDRRPKLLAAGAAAAVLPLIAVFLVWSPWSGADDDRASGREATVAGNEGGDRDRADGTARATTEASAGAPPTAETGVGDGAQGASDGVSTGPSGEASGPEDGATGPDGSGAGDGGEPGGSEEPAPVDGPVPDVVGLTTSEAVEALAAQGFHDVRGDRRTWGLGDLLSAPAACTVESQDPAPGAAHGFQSSVHLAYYAPDTATDCGL